MIATNAVNNLIAVNNETGARISDVNSSTLSVGIKSGLDSISFFETVRFANYLYKFNTDIIIIISIETRGTPGHVPSFIFC